jgi:hypothetical protein
MYCYYVRHVDLFTSLVVLKMRLLIRAPSVTPRSYERLGVRLYRRGCGVWSPLQWFPDNTSGGDGGTVEFRVVAQAQLLLMVMARRQSHEGQTCDIIVGTAPYSVATAAASVVDIKDHWHNVTQLQLRLTEIADDAPPPDYMTLMRRQRTDEDGGDGNDGNDDSNDHENDFVRAQRDAGETERLVAAVPVMLDFDSMVRGEMKGPLGQSIPILQWLQHMTRETTIRKTPRTPAMYFTWLATWYLKWAKITLADFCHAPQKFPEVLTFVCGHHVWTYAYCNDECLDATASTATLRVCDTWATGRWIPSGKRGTDCEDNATDIVTTFRALQQIDPESIDFQVRDYVDEAQKVKCDTIKREHRQLARALVHLARRYTALLADTVLWSVDHFLLHMYVKFVPTNQLPMLLEPETLALDKIGLPILTVDSTRRCWTPSSAITNGHMETLKQLHTALRELLHDACVCRECQQVVQQPQHDHCMCPQCQAVETVGEYFTWGTPCDVWQTLSQGMYHTDLRYYDVAHGRVYMPTLTENNVFQREVATRPKPPLIFGVPALSLDGDMWMHRTMPSHLVPLDAYGLKTADGGKTAKTGVVLTDITDVYLQQGPFGHRGPATTNASSVKPPHAAPKPSLPTIEESEEKQPSGSRDQKDVCLPPVPGIQYDFQKPQISWPDTIIDEPSFPTIPVFIRPEDAIKCTDKLHPNYRSQRADGRRHMFDAYLLLEIMSISETATTKKKKHNKPYEQQLRVLRMERMYVQEPEQYVYVYYVTAYPTPMPHPMSYFLLQQK